MVPSLQRGADEVAVPWTTADHAAREFCRSVGMLPWDVQKHASVRKGASAQREARGSCFLTTEPESDSEPTAFAKHLNFGIPFRIRGPVGSPVVRSSFISDKHSEQINC